MNEKQLSALRQELRQQLSELDKLLEPAFERTPIFPGYFQEYGRRCGRPHCRCVNGELHKSFRVLIPFKDGQVAVAIKRGEDTPWREKTENYRRIRKTQREFNRWQKEVSKLLDSLERARRSIEEMPVKYKGKKLR